MVFACGDREGTTIVFDGSETKQQQGVVPAPKPDSAGVVTEISTGSTKPEDLITYARSLTGIPYKYASIDPAEGFDCSGFITYVFNHFKIPVPRRSLDFTYMNDAIDLKDAKAGDLVLFTGTDSTLREVGHMGIITDNSTEGVKFIHSTSGRANGVTETFVQPYYLGRYMKTIRIFPQNK
jgi:cell wall-associated NlpC family hydrolase